MFKAASFVTVRTQACSFRKPITLNRADSTAGSNRAMLPEGFCLGQGVLKLFCTEVSIAPALGPTQYLTPPFFLWCRRYRTKSHGVKFLTTPRNIISFYLYTPPCLKNFSEGSSRAPKSSHSCSLSLSQLLLWMKFLCLSFPGLNPTWYFEILKQCIWNLNAWLDLS